MPSTIYSKILFKSSFGGVGPHDILQPKLSLSFHEKIKLFYYFKRPTDFDSRGVLFMMSFSVFFSPCFCMLTLILRTKVSQILINSDSVLF